MGEGKRVRVEAWFIIFSSLVSPTEKIRAKSLISLFLIIFTLHLNPTMSVSFNTPLAFTILNSLFEARSYVAG